MFAISTSTSIFAQNRSQSILFSIAPTAKLSASKFLKICTGCHERSEANVERRREHREAIHHDRNCRFIFEKIVKVLTFLLFSGSDCFLHYFFAFFLLL